jgi:hypothetical protein
LVKLSIDVLQSSNPDSPSSAYVNTQRRAMEELLGSGETNTGEGETSSSTSTGTSSSRLLQIPSLLQQSIAGSSRVVEHPLAIQNFEMPPYGAATDGVAFVGDA